MNEANQNENMNKENANLADRFIILDGKVNEDMSKKVTEKILKLNINDEKLRVEKADFTERPVKLILNTVGGSIYEANSIVGTVETSVTPVHTYCYGKTMSAGFYIFSSGAKRFASPLSSFMYHDASVGMFNTIEGLKNDFEWYEKLRDQMDEYLLSVTNLPREMMDYKKSRKEDWYLTAREALQYGLADELLPFRKRNK